MDKSEDEDQEGYGSINEADLELCRKYDGEDDNGSCSSPSGQDELGITTIVHEVLPVAIPDEKTDQSASCATTSSNEWQCCWNRELLLENRHGKGLKHLIEFSIEKYTGVTKRIFDHFGAVTYTSGLIFQGPYDKTRIANGVGRMIFPDGSIFYGEIINGQIGRRGIYRWSDGSLYEGNLFKGLRNGYGRFLDAVSRSFYRGQWQCSLMHGYGQIIYYNDEHNFYKGNWYAGIPWGYGLRQWPSGNFYDGEWAKGLPHGKGSKFWMNDNIHYRGEFEEGYPCGYGLMIWMYRHPANLSCPWQKFYSGFFKNGIMSGHGIFNDSNGSKFDGYWEEGRKHGKFRVTFTNGMTMSCYFVKDVIYEPTPKYLMKEVGDSHYCVPLPGPTVHQVNGAPFSDPQLSALSIPGTVYFLSEKFGFSNDLVLTETEGIGRVVSSYIEVLTDVYNVYNRLMVETSCDNAYVMRAFQFWQFLTDVVLDKSRPGSTDAQQRLFYLITAIEECYDGDSRRDVFCHPYQPITPSQFYDRLTLVAYITEYDKQVLVTRRNNVFKKQPKLNEKIYKWPLQNDWDIPGRPLKRIIEKHIFDRSGSFCGRIFDDPKNCSVLFQYISQLHRLYCYIYEFYGGQEEVMPEGLTLETFVTALKHAHIVGETGFSFIQLLNLLESEYSEIRERKDISFVLDVPITFLEFLELLISIALQYEGPLVPAGQLKPVHAKQPSSFKQKIAEAVDSVVLTAEKHPFLVKRSDVDVADFDPEFFATLREAAYEDASFAGSGNAGIVCDLSICGHRPKVFPDVDPRLHEEPHRSFPPNSQFMGHSIRYDSGVPTSKANSKERGFVIKNDGINNFEPKRVFEKRRLSEIPSMDAYANLQDYAFSSLPASSSFMKWENSVVAFFELILFPNMILLKRTNDLLVSYGYARPLGDHDEEESVVGDLAVEALSGDLVSSVEGNEDTCRQLTSF